MPRQQPALEIHPNERTSPRPTGVEGMTTDPFLTRLQTLTQLDDADLGVVSDLYSDKRSVRAKAELVAQGGKTRRLYILLDGWACRYRLLPDGQRQITQLLLPGDICNIDALRLPSSDCAVMTLTTCEITALDSTSLCAVALEHPRIGEALAWLGAVENSMLSERNASLGRRSARGRLAHLLCELRVRLDVIGRARGNEYTLPVTQEEMADVLGLTSVHLNRMLKSLKGGGIIERSSQILIIRDWNALRQEAGFRANYLHLEGFRDKHDL